MSEPGTARGGQTYKTIIKKSSEIGTILKKIQKTDKKKFPPYDQT